MLISGFSDKKLVQYLDGNVKKVCIVFRHSAADTICFLSLFERLRNEYSGIEFSLCTNYPGSYFAENALTDFDEAEYDYVFEIGYFNDFKNGHTKSLNEICCVNELGLEYASEHVSDRLLEESYSPFIAVDFTSDISSDELSCSRATAKTVCEEIRKLGYIPVDVHYIESDDEFFGYSFIDNNVCEYVKQRPDRLLSVLQHCYAFIGVAGTPMVMASKIYSGNTLCIKQGHDSRLSYTAYCGEDVKCVDEKEDVSGVVHEWLCRISDINTDVVARPFERSVSPSVKTDVKKPKTFKLRSKEKHTVVYI